MKTYTGQFYASFFAPPSEATILISDTEISIGYRNPANLPERIDWKIKAIEGAYLPAEQTSRFLEPRSKAEVRIPGRDAYEYWEELVNEANRPWHQRKKTGNLQRTFAILGSLLLAGLLTYFLLLPWLAEQMAEVVSRKTERQLGDSVYASMALSQTEDTVKTRLLNEFFSAMQVNTKYTVRIAVVEDETVNAFALPGGRIVVYTGLLESMTSYPELAALLSHEFTHVEERHATRSIFRRLGSDVFIGVLFGNMSSVGGVLAGQANEIRSLSYSRSLEKEADLKGLSLLTARKIDPKGFDDLFKHLEEAAPAGQEIPEMISSHPDTQNRVAYIQEAAKGAVVAEHPALNSIFEKIKQ